MTVATCQSVHAGIMAGGTDKSQGAVRDRAG